MPSTVSHVRGYVGWLSDQGVRQGPAPSFLWLIRCCYIPHLDKDRFDLAIVIHRSP